MTTEIGAPREARALTPYQKIEQRLSAREAVDSLKNMLPPHISVERFKRAALVAIQRQSELTTVDPASLYLAINAAAQDGLIPDGQECAIIPMKGKAVYWRMVAGLLKKARNSGEIKTIMSETVHKNDTFEYWTDEKGRHLIHKPNMLSDRGPLLGAFAMAETKDGGVYIEVMSKAQIDKRRAVSRASSNGPWVDWYDEQAKKTVSKALCKWLPSSTDILGMPSPDVEDEDGDMEPLSSFQPPAAETAKDPASAPRASARTREATGAGTIIDVPKAEPEAKSPTQVAMEAQAVDAASQRPTGLDLAPPNTNLPI